MKNNRSLTTEQFILEKTISYSSSISNRNRTNSIIENSTKFSKTKTNFLKEFLGPQSQTVIILIL